MKTEENFEKSEPAKEKSEKKELALPQGEILEIKPEKPEEYIADQREINELKQEIDSAFSEKVKGDNKETDDAINDLSNNVKQKKRAGFIKNMGIRLGKSLGWIADLIRSRVDNLDIKYSGGENIKELGSKPYLLVANHIKPKNILMQVIGLSPDSFVLEKIGGTEGEKRPKMITNITGKISKIPILGLVDKIWSPLREGVMEGMGFIPVKTRRAGKQGGFNRNFIENIRKAKEGGEPIIIFPQGHWSREFDSDLPFEIGAATIAKNYGLPIVPAYIEGADSWRSGQKVSVNIGSSINFEGKTKEEITTEIKNAIILLGEKNG